MKTKPFVLPIVLLLVACQGTLSSSDAISVSSSAGLPPVVTIDFYNLNDFHGAVEYNPGNKEIGINRLASYFKSVKQMNPNSVFVSSGDMWQGSADSNITKGRLVVDAMNAIGFDAMAIGNHEFDWTDTYLFEHQARSNFPLLGINIMDKRTNQRATFADPSIMIERSGVQIGIIGTIGANLESTILQSAVSNYDFVPYTQLVQLESTRLRELGADIVILLNHDGTVEQGVLPHVNGVFNGHTHRLEAMMLQDKPVYQGLAYGQAISHMRFAINTVNMVPRFIQNQSGVYTYESLLLHGQFPLEDESMKALYDRYLNEEINTVKNEMIGVAEGNFSRQQLGKLAVNEMLSYGRGLDSNVVASFHNSGGVRATIETGSVTYGELYKAFPFDNELMILEVTGDQLLWWLSENLYMETIPNLIPIQSSARYRIITINFLSEQYNSTSNRYPHLVDATVNTHTFIREQLKARWLQAGTIRSTDYN